MTSSIPSTLTSREDIAAYIRILAEPKTAAILALSVPWSSLRAVGAELEKNPKTGPKYLRKSDQGALRFNFSSAEMMKGIALVEFLQRSAVSDPAILEAAKGAFAMATEVGRLSSFDRSHDITEYAECIGGIQGEAGGKGDNCWRSVGYGSVGTGVAGYLGELRNKRHSAEILRRHGGGVPQHLGGLHLTYSPPRTVIRSLAVAAVLRWLPAVQNIISRLPQDERDSAAELAQGWLRDHHLLLARLSTVARKSSDEYERWKSGFGAVDMALIDSWCLLQRSVELARRMIDDDPSTGWRRADLLHRAEKAMADASMGMQELAAERFVVLEVDHFVRNKSGMAEFGHWHGGMGPAVEAMLHAKGSKFIGY